MQVRDQLQPLMTEQSGVSFSKVERLAAVEYVRGERLLRF